MPLKVLVCGVTGYIGGDILAEIQKQNKTGLYDICAIIRKQEQADRLSTINVKSIVFKGLEDLEGCRQAAADFDVVVNAASASNDAASEAWIRGLGDRHKETGKPVHFIHTSGSSILGYLSVLESAVEYKPWSDADEPFSVYTDTFPETYEHHESRIPFWELAESLDVHCYVVLPTTIFGLGNGLFSKMNGQIPDLIKGSLGYGTAIVVGQGNGSWNRIHINDLSALYGLLLYQIATTTPQELKSRVGSRPIFCAENGEHKWKESSARFAAVLKARGLLKTDEVEELSLKKAADLLLDGDEKFATLLWASSSVVRSDLARRFLDWKPLHGNESWEKHFDEAVTFVLSDGQ